MMSNCPKPILSAPLFFLAILFIHMATFHFQLSYCMIENYNSNNNIFCPEIEKEALLSLKQSLEDPYNLLSSWNNGSDDQVNCCKWKGVVCNNFTGHVQQLHLQNNCFTSFDPFENFDPFANENFDPFEKFYPLEPFENFDSSTNCLSGKINPSLLNLTQLRYLDLSGNNFTGTLIPSFIGSLRSLEYLNLSSAGFVGAIPHTIGNLSNLHTLSLEYKYYYLNADNLEWLSGLSQLEHLNMNYVNLSKAGANLVQVINKLPSLVELNCRYCSLNDLIVDPVMKDVNVSSSLAILDLSLNDFQSLVTLKWIFQLSNLIFLDLSSNSFEGPIPSISNTTKLQHIDLSFNNFNSTIPDWLYSCKHLAFVDLSQNSLHGTISNAIANLSYLNYLDLSANHEISGKIPREIGCLCKMKWLDLSYNKLQGEISDSFVNMSNCFLDSLRFLDLYDNQLFGHLTDQFGEFKSLQVLYLDRNLLSGSIPTNLGKLLSLEILSLDDNQLSGNLPESLGQLFKLEFLSIENNKLEGVVTESHFAKLTKLRWLSVSGNHLTLKVKPNWIPPFQLEVLRLGSWNLSVSYKHIPSWLVTQKNLKILDLSSTGISGLVPSFIWAIQHINLSHNHLHGKIPDRFGSELVWLSSNQFSGPLPLIKDTVSVLDLSNNSFSGGLSRFLCDELPDHVLEFLHLGGNQLTGELPDCFMNWSRLRVMNLGNNKISRSIPNSIGFLTYLWSLNLGSNKFSGQLPFPLRYCTSLVKLDLAHNNFDGNLPKWMGTSLQYLRILILRSNKLSGKIPTNICHLNSLQILDLSYNQFYGMIPRCVNNFTAAMATKRSVNNFTAAMDTERGVDNYDYSFYTEINYHYSLERRFIESATVSTKGREFQYDTILRFVTNIDLSNNNLSGDIPKELTSLVELRSLNMSGNHLTGLIPNNIGDMKQLESLDLSRNSLSGGIPNSFTTMSYLNYLNLSCNNLTGRIPESTQILGFDPSSFIGNHLCGPPLSNCSNDDKVPASVNKEENEGSDKSKIDWFYVFLSSGFTVGFSVVCTTLMFNKLWRDAYFGFMEDMWDKLYVFSIVKWRMFLRR